MARAYTVALVLATIAVGIHACKHESNEVRVDTELLERARSNEANVWYAFNDTLLPRSSGSGHSAPYLRTRYNAIAASVLDSTGRVVADTTFPQGSLIVKDLMLDASTLERYAIMLKRTGDPAADPEGWVWGYIFADGEVAVSAIDQGAVCRSCHSQSGHIDRTLMNEFFP